MSERKKASWIAWGAAVLAVGVVVYPLSYAPVICLLGRNSMYKRVPRAVRDTIWAIYLPVDALYGIAPESIRSAYDDYFEWVTGDALQYWSLLHNEV